MKSLRVRLAGDVLGSESKRAANKCEVELCEIASKSCDGFEEGVKLCVLVRIVIMHEF